MKFKGFIHKSLSIILLFLSLFLINIAYAEEYPEWKDQVIQDESGQFSADQVEEINAELSTLAHPTKVFILNQIDSSIEEYTQSAFNYFQMPDDQLLVIYVLKSNQIAAVTGDDLDNKGITSSFLNDKLNSFFKPQALQGDSLSGLHFFINEVFTEIEKYDQDHEQTTIEVVNDQPEVQPAPDESVKEKGSTLSWVVWVGLVLFIVFALFLVLILQRGKLSKRLHQLKSSKERLEERWGDVDLNFPAHSKEEEVLIRIENLHATYDDYQNRIFPELNDDFMDAYLLLKSFRIFAAKEFILYIENTLDEANYILEQLSVEVNQIVEIKTEIPVSCDKTFAMLDQLKNRVEKVGAQFGISLSVMKTEVQKKEKELLRFKVLIETEGFLDGHLIDQMNRELYQIDQQINLIDQMSEEMEEKIPNRLRNLEQRFKKADEQGETNSSTELISLLKQAREKWNSLITLWDEGRVSQLQDVITSIHSHLESGEQILNQQESQGKEIQNQLDHYENRIQEILDVYHHDLRLYDKLVRKYQLEDDPISDLMNQLDSNLKQINENYRMTLNYFDQREFGEAYPLALGLADAIDKLSESMARAHQRIHTLSFEEENAGQELKSLRNRLRMVRQQLDRSLLPGKQDQILEMIELGFKSILETEVLFDQLPLRLNKIKASLDQARDQVKDVETLTNKTIENAQETEQIIRRVNIYRTQIPQIGQLIMMAENCFRDQNFEEAVQIARKAESLLTQKKA